MDIDIVEKRGAGFSGANSGHLVRDKVCRFFHRIFGFEQKGFGSMSSSGVLVLFAYLILIWHLSKSTLLPQAQTTVPTFSPMSALWMLPGTIMSKTTIGIPLSWHRVKAVPSMTLRFRESASL